MQRGVPASNSYTGEPINDELKQHGLAIDDWPDSEIHRVLHEWAERFNREFQLGIPTPAIRVDSISCRKFGTYLPGRNGFGLFHQITMNKHHLGRSLSEVLATLLHEQLHAWQDLYGKAGQHNYHNRAFRQKARLYGLIIDSRGHKLGVAMGRFTKLLEQHGVDISKLRLDGDFKNEPRRELGMPRGNSTLKKWSCGCTNVRCAVQLAAQCLRCGNPFREAEPLW